jgi:hypothetical protein
MPTSRRTVCWATARPVGSSTLKTMRYASLIRHRRPLYASRELRQHSCPGRLSAVGAGAAEPLRRLLRHRPRARRRSRMGCASRRSAGTS